MINKPTQDEDESVAARMARYLAAKGIVSDTPGDPKPNPHIAAFQAFKVCYPGSSKSDWDHVLELHGGIKAQSVAYLRKMSDLCRRASAKNSVSDDVRRLIDYGYGYFQGRLDAVLTIAANEGDATMP